MFIILITFVIIPKGEQMKISAKGEYATLAMLELALQYQKRGPVQIHQIAEKYSIPQKFLVQILIQLKRSGLVLSRRGAEGGYLLAKPPHQISLGEVIRAIEGPLMSIKCLERDNAKTCVLEPGCTFKSIWFDISQAIEQMMNDITYEQLCQRVQQYQEQMYYI